MNLTINRSSDRFTISIDLEDWSTAPYLATSVRHLMSWREADELHRRLGQLLMDWDIENGKYPTTADEYEERRIDELDEQARALADGPF